MIDPTTYLCTSSELIPATVFTSPGVGKKQRSLISRETISRILDSADIVEVIGEYVNLKRAGQNYKGLSPFTDEKTPSFFVSPSKNIFKCFSSGKGGNVVSFLMEHEHFTYPEALKFLAKKYDIEVEETEMTPEQKEEENEREVLYNLSSFARKYFSDQLWNTETGRAIALAYFKEREFNEEIITKFQLGYCPEERRAFTDHAEDQGYKMEHLEKSGLTIVKENKSYDRFWARVIFPIHNLSGRILGFGARTLRKGENIPKYLNSPESEIYHKSKVLYGLFFAKGAIIKEDNCYLVEGYTDVISLHQAGFENVVSSSGTALTEDQVRMIGRYTKNITILYDGDPAGIKASFRGIDMILEQGMNVRIVLFPEEEDPDSYARKHRKAEVDEFLKTSAVDFIRFKTGILLEEVGDDPIKRAGLIREIVTSISLIPDAIARSVYVQECSSMLDVSEQALMNELNKLLRKKFYKKSSAKEAVEVPPEPEPHLPPQREIDITDSEFQERGLIQILLKYGSDSMVFTRQVDEKHFEDETVVAARFIIDEVRQDDIRFTNPLYQKIFDSYVVLMGEEAHAKTQLLIEHDDQEISMEVTNLILSPHELSPGWKEQKITVVSEKDKLKDTVLGVLYSFKAKKIEKQIREKQQELKETSDEIDQMNLLKEIKKLKAISLDIYNELRGRVIIY
jgi:DNA primase